MRERHFRERIVFFGMVLALIVIAFVSGALTVQKIATL
jgi:hypothetical protein